MPFNVSEFANDASDPCDSTPATGQKDQYYFTFFKDLPSDEQKQTPQLNQRV